MSTGFAGKTPTAFSEIYLFGNLPLKTGLFYVEAVFARESDEKDYPFNLNASRPK